VQKFTRSLTREVELAGERLAFTLSEQGIAVRPVGSRKPPREISWARVLCDMAGKSLPAGREPSPEELAEAVQHLKSAPPAPRPPEPAIQEQPPAPPAPSAERTTKAPKQVKRPQEYTALLSRLDAWFATHRPYFLRALHPGASVAELDTLQSELKLPLPVGLRTLLAWHNGQSDEYPGRFEENWRLMNTKAIAEAKNGLETESVPGKWQAGWIPFLDDDSGDYLFLDTTRPEIPVRGYWQGSPEQPVIASSLTEWLEGFVDAVERGDYQEDPERGTFSKSK
jgi:cell wall assembly regulator SMI1